MKEHKQVILGSVGLVLVMALMFFFLISPRKADLAEAKEAVTAAESETVVLQTDLTRLQGLQKNAPQLQAALDQIRKLVPDDDNVSNFVFQTQQEADESGLEFVSITPQLPRLLPRGPRSQRSRSTSAPRAPTSRSKTSSGASPSSIAPCASTGSA